MIIIITIIIGIIMIKIIVSPTPKYCWRFLIIWISTLVHVFRDLLKSQSDRSCISCKVCIQVFFTLWSPLVHFRDRESPESIICKLHSIAAWALVHVKIHIMLWIISGNNVSERVTRYQRAHYAYEGRAGGHSEDRKLCHFVVAVVVIVVIVLFITYLFIF